MTRPKRPGMKKSSGRAGKSASGQTGPRQAGSGQPGPSRGRPKPRAQARSRDGSTRDASKVAREPASLRDDTVGSETPSNAGGRRYGSVGSAASKRTTTSRPATTRSQAPRLDKKKPLPELKRVQLNAPAPDTMFTDRDGEKLTFPDSNLRRVAAQILTEKRKAWRYRPFSFPLFTDKGHEQTFHFDFYVYDAEDSVIKLILVIPTESREVWDRVGRFKRQYPMYDYELWTPEKLHQLSGPRGRLGF